ncbi:hypothetical protein E2C01_071689 [Portunus trituberculatus]|uniref:Uncharacterized protein n=1 Tax=Portunus trituberculatus TaxID=210409 RepID=A0A5B7HXN6_PORTR|nr:hypothetical protein [Portunus trituberculatus]
MSPVAVGLSLLGGWVSAVSILGNATEVYFYGTQLVTSLLGCIPAAILVGKVILPLLYELRIISINENGKLAKDQRTNRKQRPTQNAIPVQVRELAEGKG